jgi:hypothetical protein
MFRNSKEEKKIATNHQAEKHSSFDLKTLH